MNRKLVGGIIGGVLALTTAFGTGCGRVARTDLPNGGYIIQGTRGSEQIRFEHDPVRKIDSLYILYDKKDLGVCGIETTYIDNGCDGTVDNFSYKLFPDGVWSSKLNAQNQKEEKFTREQKGIGSLFEEQDKRLAEIKQRLGIEDEYRLEKDKVEGIN